ncbi:hypothetical protein M422DRAFT_40801 [Sphaerobolus stellatus SS14]|nr:hypothetical protein M422DRAFT_40801 [Sphaerobolus stellatus SS14]
MSAMTYFPFEALVWDLQYYLVNFHLSPRDLYSFCLVSRKANSVANPALYRHIRLLYGLDYNISCEEAPKGDHTQRLRLAHDSFIGHVTSSPELAGEVQWLEWEIGQYHQSTGDIFIRVFPLLANVRRVHLSKIYSFSLTDVSRQHIPPVFPRVEDITFTGLTEVKYAMSVLHTPSNIRSISLDCITPLSTCRQLLEWISTAELPNLSRLHFRTKYSSVVATEIFSSWKEAVYATRKSVKELTLHFLPDKDSTWDKDHLTLANDALAEDILTLFCNSNSELSLQQLCLGSIVPNDHQIHQLQEALPGVRILLQ